MELILMQHGVAMSEDQDSSRPLTDVGREETARVAAWLAVAGVKPTNIRHSGKTRAEQTAAIMALVLQPAGGVDSMSSLGPGDSVETLAAALNQQSEDIMLVGHLPHLSRLASQLLAGDADKEIVGFRNSGAVCLQRNDSEWTLQWIITPDCVPKG